MAVDEPADGRDHLFRDSKLGVLVGGLSTIAIDGVLDALISGLTDYDPSAGGWGWGTTIIAAAAGTVLAALTAYKAKRRASRTGR